MVNGGWLMRRYFLKCMKLKKFWTRCLSCHDVISGGLISAGWANPNSFLFVCLMHALN